MSNSKSKWYPWRARREEFTSTSSATPQALRNADMRIENYKVPRCLIKLLPNIQSKLVKILHILHWRAFSTTYLHCSFGSRYVNVSVVCMLCKSMQCLTRFKQRLTLRAVWWPSLHNLSTISYYLLIKVIKASGKIFSFCTVNSAAAFYESIATITGAAWKNKSCHSGHHKRMIPATYISLAWLYKNHLSCRQPYKCRSLSWILAQSPPFLTLPHVTILPSANTAANVSKIA